eukprot:scaffold48_cov311-Pinguiococcus_pyrenoidosus.AAC.241
MTESSCSDHPLIAATQGPKRKTERPSTSARSLASKRHACLSSPFQRPPQPFRAPRKPMTASRLRTSQVVRQRVGVVRTTKLESFEVAVAKAELDKYRAAVA